MTDANKLTYVYGIVGPGHPCDLTDITGVGDPPSVLRRLDAGTIAAVVGDAPAELRAKRRDVHAHQAVIDYLIKQGTVLPMRFGVVAGDEESLRQELVEDADMHLAMLEDLQGRLEVNVKAFVDEDELVRRAALEDPTIQQLRDQSAETIEDQIRLGEAVAAAVDVARQRIAEHIVDLLAGNAVRTAEGPPIKGAAANLSFLVDRDDLSSFAERVDEVAAELAPEIRVQRVGPLAPYSFVAVATDSELQPEE